MAAVGEIVVRSWRHTFAGLLPEDFLSSLTCDAQRKRHERAFAGEDVRYRIAADGTRVVGFVSWGPARISELAGRIEIHALYLRPGCERRGTGRRLFDRVLAEVSGSQRQGLGLTALAINPNCAFYRRLDGTEIAVPDICLGGAWYRQTGFLWP